MKYGKEVLEMPELQVTEYQAEQTGDLANGLDIEATEDMRVRQIAQDVYLMWAPGRGQWKTSRLGNALPKN